MTLPDFVTTEEALRFGISMTPLQYVLCDGARQALQREFDRLDRIYKENSDRGKSDRALLQVCSDLATTIQKLREAQECAPHSTLCAVHLGFQLSI